ncbi:SphA family protein [Bradyrhizobium paxllaeri]|uniref:SphA family protein n=1 Tax=Bradyrhizobium paxllaeri TaxID=190148 RepID=UPI000810E812|nr:transporter [Bradyrhizobium paxllaeri]
MGQVKSRVTAGLAAVPALLLFAHPQAAWADAGGLSFWLPGIFGSLAAAPAVPGWSTATIYLHLQSSAGGEKDFIRGGNVVAGLNARADVVVQGFTYTFATPFLGAQAAVSILGAPGNVDVGIDATLTGPRGNTISGSRSDNRWTFADVFYQGTLKWNQGVHNEMVYVTGNIPSGTYDVNRLANLSFGFVAVDAGAGYTYLNPKTGNEFSIVGGLTYSFENTALQYQNGIDFHVDWAASHFLSKNMLVGLGGYYFQQLTGDSGPGARLGDFKGRVLGIGPQVGFIFPLNEGYQGYLNLRGFRDFAAENRPEGWTAWVTFAVSPAPPEHAASKPITRKY